MSVKQDLTINKGKTFKQKVRWETTPIVYKPITGISQAAPALITCVAHGVPDGWRVAVTSTKGMTQINAANRPPKGKDYHEAAVKTSSTIELNDVNAAEYSAYLSGGYIQYNTPVDLTGYTARMSLRASDKPGTVELLRLDTATGGIVIDNSVKTVTIVIAAAVTAALTFSKALYDLEMINAAGEVFLMLSGAVIVINEITST